MHDSIYSPEEDSYLMSEILSEKIPALIKKNPELNFLEMGSGSGINLKTVLSLGIKKQNIFSCDINPEAVKHCKKLGFRCIRSDLFENIDGEFNIIIFNPPYLPEDYLEPKESKTATTGGKKGNEIITRFLKQVKSHLEKNGKIFLITSSLAEKVNFKKYGYESNLIKEEKLFFEKLSLWELNIF